MNKHIKIYEDFVKKPVNEETVNESVYGEYVKKVGPALTKFLKEKGLNWPTPFKATEQRGGIQIDSAPVSGKDLGIMQYGFKSVVLSTRFGNEVSIMSDGVPDLIVFGLSYQYEHPSGGTNGTDLILPGTRYANVFYSKTNDKFYTWETQPNAEMKMNESDEAVSESTFTVEDAIKVQSEQLAQWKKLLQPKVYKDLEKWATEHNDKAESGGQIVRGTDMDNFIGNYFNSYTPSNKR